ncbi:MAG: hypothetical protein AAGI30_01630, partial [Planctomycetota bacterium]
DADGDLSKVMSIRDLRNWKGRQVGLPIVGRGYDLHHIAQKQYAREMFDNANITVPDLDEMPGAFLHRGRHRRGYGPNHGPGQPTIHDLIEQEIGDIQNNPPTNVDILDALKEAYSQFDAPEYWDMAEKWLLEKGITR